MGLFSTTPSYLSKEFISQLLPSKNILVIGGTAGIGKALALSCLSKGANVTIVGRRQPDPSLAKAQFISKDLSLMKNASSLAKEIDTSVLDAIVFTNGIIASKNREETPEGIEKDMAVSYLSRFAFMESVSQKNDLGSKRSDKSTKPRIFVMGFPGKPNKAVLDDFNSEKKYSVFPVHMNTVVGNEAFIKYLADSFPTVNVYGLNPGLIYTEIRDNYLIRGSFLSNMVETLIKWTNQSAEQYAEKVLTPLMISPELENMNQSLFENNGTLLKPNPFLLEQGNHDKVIEESKKLLQKAQNA